MPSQFNSFLCMSTHVIQQVLTSHFGHVYFALLLLQTSHFSNLKLKKIYLLINLKQLSTLTCVNYLKNTKKNNLTL